MKIPFVVAALVFFAMFTTVARADEPSSEDNYLRGYSSAVLDIQYHLHPSITVKNGILTIDSSTIPSSELNAVHNSLASIPGVKQIIVQNASQAGSVAQPVQAASGSQQSQGAQSAADNSGLPPQYQVDFTQQDKNTSLYTLPTGVFPAGRL
ncbi:MAG TPA: hypothetical protein VKJ65_10060, partial [Phycisphaerae bacterium]|nr:hypothetical protein [Phycisphaerae bacterium]